MGWTMYRVTLPLLTPLHAGWRTMGNVQYARPYVTGKTLWGALTARLTRDTTPAHAEDYRRVGKQVNAQLAFSYLYPTTRETVAIWPWGEKADEFTWRYLNTYASTALDYGRNAAEDGSLHETEYIAPTTRDGAPVYLAGYIFERTGCRLPWRDALPRLQLGGERTYGWGRVGQPQVDPGGGTIFNQWTVGDLSADRPALRADHAAFLLAHALAHGSGALGDVKGAIEPLVGRETQSADAHGQKISCAQVCWSPGGSVDAVAQISIAHDGLWQAI
jgi:hypothetical protein